MKYHPLTGLRGLMRRYLIVSLFFITGLFLGGCKPPPTYEVTKANVAKTKNMIDKEENKQYPAPAPVVTKSSPYVDTTKISLLKRPEWLKRQVTMRGNNLPLSFYLSEALEGSGALAQYDKTVDKKRPISIDYTGDVYGALEEIAMKTDYYFDIDYKKNSIIWSNVMTKIFDVSFMPGTTTYLVGRGQSGGGGSLGGESSGGGFGYDITKDDQFSQIQGSLSLWEDLEKTIRDLMSKEGKVSVSQATTSVTVSDHPANIKSVSKYIDKMNKELSRQVRLHVDILEVKLRDEYVQGINWDLMHIAGDQFVNLTSPGFDNINIVTDALSSGFAFKAPNPQILKKNGASASPWLNSNTVIQMLSLQGEVQAINRPTLTTLNNQVAQLAVQELENYLSQVTSTLNDSFSQASSETDTVTTGIMVYLLPKIKGNEVYLQVSANLSVLESLTEKNTGVIATRAGTSPGGGSIIQLPKVASRIMNQRAVIPSGKCLILSGFKKLDDEVANDQLFGFQALGGMASSRRAVEIVMLITPTILSTDDEIEDNA